MCKMRIIVTAACIAATALSLTCCISSGVGTENNGTDSQVMGFGILNRLPGLWNGPVSSTTPAGSFDLWYVDFRPVSPGQVSQYSTLDANTVNYISFFIVKHGGRLKVAMRTEGVFMNKGCVTYEVIDTVRESEGYYRFSDFQAGPKRAYTEFAFKDDRFVMSVYTNKFNTSDTPLLHSRWEARLGDKLAAAEAIAHFKFPQPVMIKDFTDVFKNMSESIFFTFENDPYSSLSQPYVGKVTVNVSTGATLKIDTAGELFLVLTTAPLYDGVKYLPENLKYMSKYVYLPATAKSYTFNNVHPGKYYLYAVIDANNDKKHSSGDFMDSNVTNTFTLQPSGTVTVGTFINFVIP